MCKKYLLYSLKFEEKKMQVKHYILIISIFISAGIFAQNKSSVPGNTVKKAAKELSISLDEEKPDDVVAADYENLARKFADAANYAKAEENWQKARKIYLKLKNTEKVAAIDREIAKLQELQNKTDDAISSYESAQTYAKDKVEKKLNANDVQRLKNSADLNAQSSYIQENIELADKKSDRADAYKQMANLKLAENKKEEAISNLQNALQESESKEEAIEIKQKIAGVYSETADYEKAVEIRSELVSEAKTSNNQAVAIEQLQQMSLNYFSNNERKKGIETLQQAYALAIEQRNTLAAKNCLDLLIAQYRKTKDTKKIIHLYDDFAQKFDSIIAGDSSLIDTKTILSIEQRVAQLEKERALKDELIARKNTLNYFLVGLIAVILIFAVFVVKALYSINKKNKRIALQSLRREMNPHFIFNSLNSVNHFIAENNELEANKYLSSYSKLMRNTMENSNKDFIPLSVELAQLKEYLQLEYMRFRDKFDYTIDIDPNLDTDAVLIPNMLIQPQLENAIWHGLRYKTSKGSLLLKIFPEDKHLIVKVEDNGIGIKRSQELKTEHQKQHRSRGMTNTRERISLLNSLYHTNISLEINEKKGSESGVTVILKIEKI
jgi:tetratricopeptide (TPR) repeat protein